MDIGIMIEGQMGLNWDRWKRIAETVESCGFYGLFRSDHFTNPNPPNMDSLECWVSLTWIASHTERIAFGPLVTPASFRHPVFTARMAKDVDNLSGGRLTLGIGAGWQEREHALFGFDLLDMDQRFDRFEESAEVISRLLRDEDPVQFNGEFYNLQDAVLLPPPSKNGRPPILIGGNGVNRTLPLAAKYANEWNGNFIPPDRFQELNQLLDGMIQERGRDPEDVVRSIMHRIIFGRDQEELNFMLKNTNRSQAELLKMGVILGTPSEIKAQIDRFAQAGAQRIMLQWIELDNMDRLEGLASALNLL
jgi:F420-dependent oxidoreductase-like protein